MPAPAQQPTKSPSRLTSFASRPVQPVQHTPSQAPATSANCRCPAFITTWSSEPGAATSQKLVQLPVAKGAPLHIAILPAPAAVDQGITTVGPHVCVACWRQECAAAYAQVPVGNCLAEAATHTGQVWLAAACSPGWGPSAAASETVSLHQRPLVCCKRKSCDAGDKALLAAPPLGFSGFLTPRLTGDAQLHAPVTQQLDSRRVAQH